MTGRDAASERQVQAADPRKSTWLSANAGSGKTRVLTDRVARLLLDGVSPQNILCLTYTKAAASEMQNRLFRRLGDWAMMDGDRLAADLSQLGAEGPVPDETLRQARRLFAKAIETPGGLRIQTIHSFCAGLLRRFPLEAGVSPQFTEIEERAAELLRAEVVDDMSLGSEAGLVAAFAREFGQDAIEPLLKEIVGRADQFAKTVDDAEMRLALGLTPGLTEAILFDATLEPEDWAAIAELRAACAAGSAMDVKAAGALSAIGSGPVARHADLERLEGVFLTGDGAKAPFSAKIGSFPTKGTRAAHPDLMARIEPLMERIEVARTDRLRLRNLERSRALHRFAHAFLPRYEARKLRAGALDFDDLIARTRALLTDPRVAQWVLFRLDGGLDHILIDEAQDTSPAQWAVIRLLAQEFAAGEGARPDRRRTVFVVGDRKQSIYSFQGADPEEFGRMEAHFRAALAPVDPLISLSLDHSFRSAAEILRVVDETFRHENDGLGDDQPLHRAFKTEMPGRVDLWPPLEREKGSQDPAEDWTRPVDELSPADPKLQLAEAIATEIARMKQAETIPVEIERSGSYARRPVTEGDILILVRGRTSGLFDEIIRALKKAELRVAGADRLRIGAELAVRDIAATLRFLSLPEDDLSLAAALRSPLFGWTEQELFTLAHGRAEGVYLWQVLRDAADDHANTLAVLDDLRSKSEFLRPYDLITRMLIHHDGRRRLIARLGVEAEDGIDALLSQALAYEQSNVPGLTGFLEWMEADQQAIKRQVESKSDQIRVMTVHGAKGLEAPIVFLPDTAKPKRDIRDAIYATGDTALWAPAKAEMPPEMIELREDRLAAQDRERQRLLYVAMTRSECWLIACAAGETGRGGDSWHSTIAAGLAHVGAEDHDFPTGTGRRFGRPDWDQLPLIDLPGTDIPVAEVPQFGPVPPLPRPVVLSPSDLGGAKILPDDPSEADRDTALALGQAVHVLLEHLPLHVSAERMDHGLALLSALPDAGLIGDHRALVGEVAALIDLPAMAAIFAPDTLAEVPVTADLPGGQRVSGVIDRLILGPDKVTAIDFKTNRLTPNRAEDTPEGLLRQMGAYDAMLRAVFPLRQIEVAILWTTTANLMVLPQHLVSAALVRATAP